MRHSRYDLFLSKILVDRKGIQFYGEKDKYNLYCFLRWVAMAGVGGGFMSDYVTLSLNVNASFILLNNGTLSIRTCKYGFATTLHKFLCIKLPFF